MVVGVAAQDPVGTVRISRDALAAFEHYRALDQPQYFALSADGARYGYSYCHEGLCPRLTPPKQMALDACADAGGRQCRIIAAGARVDGSFAVFGGRTSDPLAEEMFRVTRDLVPNDQVSDDQLWEMIASATYALHGALAYSAQGDRWGMTEDVDNAAMARDLALQRCAAADCAVVLELGPQTLCVAYATGSGAAVFATNATDFSARKAAERKCAAATKGCAKIETACSGRAPSR